MIYKFKSKASGDVIMLEPHGNRLLELLGRQPAAQGIIEPAAMPAAIAALEAAIGAEDAAGAPPEAAGPGTAGAPEQEHEPPVSMGRRLWPMLDMLRRAAAAGVPVVWGV